VGTRSAEAAGEVNEETYFIGHSMGCQTIARYLEGLPEGQKVGGAIFVAGFFTRLTNLEQGEEDVETIRSVEKEWLTTPLDLTKVSSHLPKSVAIFSDNDLWVPLDNQDAFRDELSSEIIVEHEKGHFTERDGVTELPVVLERFLDLSK
jgi:predicted alpha/beta hydrolase family esterase